MTSKLCAGISREINMVTLELINNIKLIPYFLTR